MIGMKRVLQLLGAKFEKRSDTGFDWYDYRMPNGDLIQSGPRDQWRYEFDGLAPREGQGEGGLWDLAFPRFTQWQCDQENKANEAANKRYMTAKRLLEAIVKHLNAVDWTAGDGNMRVVEFNTIRKYRSLSIEDCRGKSEGWVEFNDDGSIANASIGTKHCTGLVSIKRAAKRYYDFEG